MKQLWAPWRIDYVLKSSHDSCIFCDETFDTPDSLLLYKDNYTGIMLNKYPYNNGHLLVYPLKHLSDIEDLNLEASSSLFCMLKRSTVILKTILSPDGFNIGLNLGKAAGAGIDSHIHFHVVPRWNGDFNFMPLLADVKVIPQHLKDSREKLLAEFEKL